MEVQEEVDISDNQIANSNFGNPSKRPLTSPAPNERTNKLADSLRSEMSNILAPLGRSNIGKPSIVGKAKADGKRDMILSLATPEEAFRISLDIGKHPEIKISQSKHYSPDFFDKISKARLHLQKHLGKEQVMYKPTRDGRRFAVKVRNNSSEQWKFAGLTGFPFDSSEIRMCGGWSPFLLHGIKVPEVIISPKKIRYFLRTSSSPFSPVNFHFY